METMLMGNRSKEKKERDKNEGKKNWNRIAQFEL
jgi:hypothetical protein